MDADALVLSTRPSASEISAQYLTFQFQQNGYFQFEPESESDSNI